MALIPSVRLAAGEPADIPLDELDRVTTCESVQTDRGVLASGSTGTIVAVWAGGEAYEVEFTRPPALVTLRPAQVRPEAAA